MNEPGTSPQAGFDLNHPTIIALLYLGSFVVGITALIGLVLAYVWRGEAGSGWETSHYTFHIRTFWIALVAACVSTVLMLVLIGFIGFVVIGIWVVVRTVLALLAAQKRQPIANPESWLW
ncbi:DUF4870 family protein [Sphingomonas fennica]|uniref:DUF4870 domain-containing protein n=1 Tax=Edaphosphingomonas fennica TaxID=114404 RepID=A0A2T4I052_9SPHN|nr:hypothetical protein [Sphingomonas fennica]PTD22048.1 hypothetical protein CV103_09720 [Sphingomonas fennica]